MKKIETLNSNGKSKIGLILREIEIISTTKHENILNYIECYLVDRELWVKKKKGQTRKRNRKKRNRKGNRKKKKKERNRSRK